MPLVSQSNKLEKYNVHILAANPFLYWISGFFCFCLMFFPVSHVSAYEESYETAVVTAAKNGDPHSQYALALLYEYGGETIERDPLQSIYWLEKAGEAEVAGACLYLGLKYEYGNRVTKDLKKAVCWFACAAHKDWPAAQFFLATLYEKGKGVPRSLDTALLWFGLAADYGYPGAEKEFLRLHAATGKKNLDELKVAQDILMQTAETYCK